MREQRRVYVRERDFMGRVEIALIRREGEKRFIEHYLSKEQLWQITPVEYGAIDPGPTLILDGNDAIELYRELHKFFTSRGVRNKDESFTEGELTATKKHLADFRFLLKLPGAIPAPKEGT